MNKNDFLIIKQISDSDSISESKKIEMFLKMEDSYAQISELLEGVDISINRINQSITHKAIEAIKNGRFFPKTLPTEDEKQTYIEILRSGHVFIINQDLPGIAEHHSFVGNCEIMLPFEVTIFEISICSSRIICVATQKNNESPDYALMLFSNNGSLVPLDLRPCLLVDEIRQKIETICIFLDSEVAQKTVIRAPIELNKKRQKTGKEKIKDHYFIDLLKRNKYSITGEQRGPGVRLHFRRGHWRHFETHKTWVKWTLVGDKDLGFVEKGYRL